MCIYCDYCVYHYKSTELVSLYTLDIGLKINIIIINIEILYLLVGIAPPEIRRSVCARVERTKQVEIETPSLFGHTPAIRRLKSRRIFLTSVQPVHFPANVVRANEEKIGGKGTC